MSSFLALGLVVGFLLAVFFLASNASVAFEIAEDRGRWALGWGLFGFLFPVVGPLLVFMLPRRPPRSS